MDSPSVSFIGIVDFSENATWVFLTESVSDLLGYEPHELVGTPSLDLVHPDEFSRVKHMHYDTIRQDKAAVLAYLRMKHKDPYKGYILCAISRTVAYNVLVGSVSFASMGPKAMHNASTAQEVTVITPSAANFEFRRWNDPSPMPPSTIAVPLSSGAVGPEGSVTTTTKISNVRANATNPVDETDELAERVEKVITFDPLPKQSIRTAFILDRFSLSCPIIYCSNDTFLPTTTVMGRSFFDFVAKKDEDLVRSWIDAVKGWGVNERGQPSDGGFGFGKFQLYRQGRDSSERQADPPPARQRHRDAGGPGSSTRTHGSHSAAPSSATSRVRRRLPSSTEESEMAVDAIFSAHSDGLMVILRHASPVPPSSTPVVLPSTSGGA
ncbi:uncharacterized protein STEHIDRAFT_168836 [Stereum hirsutum FP-91666 SS1]|uniref:uncharacterized protein n=1 Tax=Stereum hirsutum (strain FP-91666) TaxID=721885 RepID=UPI00044494D2|nr:uncharacterized protein STEHIDRAFT_168836 [Stereum hirsutum FP-91666 SS1]EIM85752.1 hypothetical protein STEHIDRAFT_168836 [Stereum hirsutum FP-91666 SS1]